MTDPLEDMKRALEILKEADYSNYPKVIVNICWECRNDFIQLGCIKPRHHQCYESVSQAISDYRYTQGEDKV